MILEVPGKVQREEMPSNKTDREQTFLPSILVLIYIFAIIFICGLFAMGGYFIYKSYATRGKFREERLVAVFECGREESCSLLGRQSRRGNNNEEIRNCLFPQEIGSDNKVNTMGLNQNERTWTTIGQKRMRLQ